MVEQARLFVYDHKPRSGASGAASAGETFGVWG